MTSYENERIKRATNKRTTTNNNNKPNNQLTNNIRTNMHTQAQTCTHMQANCGLMQTKLTHGKPVEQLVQFRK